MQMTCNDCQKRYEYNASMPQEQAQCCFDCHGKRIAERVARKAAINAAMERVTYETRDKIKTWGGWYQHTIVKLDGIEIGRIQTRRRNKRTDTLTLDADSCVIGGDVPWLVGQAIAK